MSSDPQPPNIVLSRKARKMMQYAVQTHPNKEVQGFGRIRLDHDGDVWVTDIIIPPHEVTGSTVELTPETLSALWGEIVAAGDEVKDYRLWWHSHAGMNTFASGTDTETLRALAVEFGDVAIGIVTNSKEDYHAWYAASVQTDLGQFLAEGKLTVMVEEEPEDRKLRQKVAKMMLRVTEKKAEVQKYVPLVKSHDGHEVGQYYGFPGLMSMLESGSEVGLVNEADTPPLDEPMGEEETAYYSAIRATYPNNHETHNMTMDEFADWYNDMLTGAESTHSVGSGV